jgi:hypothetical protein
MVVKMPFTPSVKDEEGESVKKLSPAMDAAIKRRMKLMKSNPEEDAITKTKKVGY